MLTFLFCISTDTKVDAFQTPKHGYVKVEMDSPATISWGLSQSVKKYKLYCRYHHDDTSWFIIDSILRGDSAYIKSSYTIQREAITERLFHSCKEDTLFFITLQSINDDNTYYNNIHYFIDSSVCFGNWILWKSGIVPLKPFPMRVRYFE